MSHMRLCCSEEHCCTELLTDVNGLCLSSVLPVDKYVVLYGTSCCLSGNISSVAIEL